MTILVKDTARPGEWQGRLIDNLRRAGMCDGLARPGDALQGVVLDLVGGDRHLGGCAESLWFSYRKSNVSNAHLVGVAEWTSGLPTVDIELHSSERGHLGTARFGTHWAAWRVRRHILNNLHTLLTGCLDSQPAATPRLNLPLYAARLTAKLARKAAWTVLGRMGLHFEHWSLALGQGDFVGQDAPRRVSLTPPKGEFWADPFLLERGGRTWLFVERFPYDTKRGVIAVAEIKGDTIGPMTDCLARPYHLSYPHVFEEDGEVYMMPECSEARRLEVWRAVDFPLRWELHATALQGQPVVDPVYFRTHSGERWLLAGLGDTAGHQLHAWRVDSLKFNHLEPHRRNPVVTDCRHARNGGRVWVQDGTLVRPAQDNSHGHYGHGVSARRIDALTISEYAESTLTHTTAPVPGAKGTHHVCQIPGMHVMDICTYRGI